jgi:hypothetical protein
VVLLGVLCVMAGSTSTAAASATGEMSAVLTSARRPTPVDEASTSTRGVTATSINVVFPVVSLSSLAGKLGFAEDVEFGEQKKAINLFVNQINASGGIHGRKINPIIVTFTPENTTEMRALCKDWTEGSPAAFAVLDGEGTWSGTNQLCITQEGHTPFIGQWTTVSNWTTDGSPYLWWTGPADTTILQAVVDWGLATGLLGGDRKVGIIAGNRASDQLALKDYLLPDLRRAGVKAVVETIAANPTETATTDADAPLIVQKLKAAGVDSVIPLLPFNAFFPVLQAQTQQSYFPKLLLSDYESSIESALGLVQVPYEKALNGQEGVTTETLGGVDDTRPESEGGYDPSVRSCFDTWHKAYPQVPKGNKNYYIEEQGPVQGWCQEIRLFATAAKAAGRNLDRRTFVEAMSKIRDYPGGYSPIFTFGPDKFSGPTEYRVVKLRDNTPPSTLCSTPKDEDNVPVGTCWVVMQGWRPLPSTG